MNFVQKYLFYIQLSKLLKKSEPMLVGIQKTMRKGEPRTTVSKWDVKDMYSLHDVHDLKYDWHTLIVLKKGTDEKITEFDGFVANMLLKRFQKSK